MDFGSSSVEAFTKEDHTRSGAQTECGKILYDNWSIYLIEFSIDI